MKRQHLIGKLRHTQAAMRETAALMRAAGIEQHPSELDGAANIIDSWVEGIRTEQTPTGAQPSQVQSLARRVGDLQEKAGMPLDQARELALSEACITADNQWFGDMMILQVLADSENVNEQEREVLTRWMAASQPPGVTVRGKTMAELDSDCLREVVKASGFMEHAKPDEDIVAYIKRVTSGVAPSAPLAYYDPTGDRVVTATQMHSMLNHQGLPGKSAAKSYTTPLGPVGVAPSQPPSAGLVDCGECRTQGCRAGKCRNAGVAPAPAPAHQPYAIDGLVAAVAVGNNPEVAVMFDKPEQAHGFVNYLKRFIEPKRTGGVLASPNDQKEQPT